MSVHDDDFEVPAPGALQARQPVELEIVAETELGYKAVIDDRYIGLIYFSYSEGKESFEKAAGMECDCEDDACET